MQRTKYNFGIREYIFNYLCVSINFETIVCYFDKQIIKNFFSWLIKFKSDCIWFYWDAQTQTLSKKRR